MRSKRKYPIGAELLQGGISFRVWAPEHKKAYVYIECDDEKPQKIPLKRDKEGYFSVFVPNLEPPISYRFSLGTSGMLLADPASRYQPVGVEGPSCVLSTDYEWHDESWLGVNLADQIIYEMHIGTFTVAGTFAAAAEKIPYLKKIGITMIELMPINEFPGHFGWGYDGVYLFAPYHFYGTPSDVKSFVDKAHAAGIAVVLDVVYNHFGPEGNYFSKFTPAYFNPSKTTDWGDAINFDHPSVREYFLTNAIYWIEEFHFDGLRVDATPWFFCNTPTHILQELSQAVRSAYPPHKTRVVIGESERQDTKLLYPYEKGGYQFDALWNDDFHHTACVRLKGKREAYYTDYLGSPQEFISALKYGFLYQGQYYTWQKAKRGTFDLNLSPASLIAFLENHDQVANTGNGKRLYEFCDFSNFKAMSCLLLLAPQVPLIFQGQEFGSTAPFNYFSDHNETLNKLIFAGRKKELSQFPNLSTKEAQKHIKNPFDPLTFTECKLDFAEVDRNADHFNLYVDLIHLRKHDPVFKDMSAIKIDGAVLSADAFVIRYFGADKGDRLLVVNFGSKLIYSPAPEPLVAPGTKCQWEILWSSEAFIYGGEGTQSFNNNCFMISGHCAIVLKTIQRLK
jgi:maltooligosyltrehalose trehalohydrolase